jgi:antiviral helicase SKI2
VRTAGILLRDGIVGGPRPHLSVLEISTVDAKRSASDLLPYLPRFRSMFNRLPKKPEEVKSGVTQVELDDVECVTVTAIKVRGPPWYLQIRKGIDERDQIDVTGILKLDPVQKQFAEEEFTSKYSDWENTCWDEVEWDRVKDLQVRELLLERSKVAQVAQQGQCLKCPHFLKHVSIWMFAELAARTDMR